MIYSAAKEIYKQCVGDDLDNASPDTKMIYVELAIKVAKILVPGLR